MLLRLKVIGILLPMLLFITAAHGHDERVKPTPTTSYHQFQTIQNLIILDAALNGQVGKYILDTGASGLVLNARQFAGKEKQPKAILTASGQTIQTSSSTIDRFRLGHLYFENLPVAHMALDQIEDRLGIELHGLIGMDVLSTTDIYIDFDQGWIVLQDDLDMSNDPDIILPIKVWEQVPVLEVKMNGQSLNMAVDIGATKTLLDEAIVKNHQLKTIDQTNLQSGNQSITVVDIVQVENMSIGHIAYNPQALSLNLSELSDNQISIHGLIGNDFLKSRKVLISMQSKEIKIWE